MPKNLSKEEKAVAKDIEKQLIKASENSVSRDGAVLGEKKAPASKMDKWLDPEYKMSKEEVKEAKQEIRDFYNSDLRQGVRNGRIVANATPEQRERGEEILALQNKVDPISSFASGMLGKIPSLVSGIAQGVTKAAKGIVNAGNSAWINDEQKAAATNALSNAEKDIVKAREEANIQQRNMATQNPVANIAGNLTGTALMYGAANKALEGTAAAESLASTLGERGSNLVLGQAADTLLDTIPTEVENYQNGMRGKDLAIDTLKNQALNAAVNTGAEFIPGLIKSAWNNLNGKNIAQAADVAKSAPISEPISDISKQINPEETAITALANQQKQAAENIENLSKQIPEVPEQNFRDSLSGIIDARNTGRLAEPGSANTDIGQAFIKQLDDLDKEYQQAVKLGNAADPEVKRLRSELAQSYGDAIKTATDVKNPIDTAALGKYQDALDNLENYVKQNTENIPAENPSNLTKYGDKVNEYINGLEMSNEARMGANDRLKDMDNILNSIKSAKSADEVKSLMDEAKAMTGDVDDILQKNAATRTIGKYDFDESTKNFAEAINGKRIYITPEMKAELNFTNVSKLNDSLAFKSNGKIYKPKFTTNATTGTPIDTIFPELDAATGGAISNFMRNNGMDPDNTANMAKGISDYVSFLKANKDSVKVQKYTGGMFDDFSEAVQKAGKEKIDSFGSTAKQTAKDIPNTEDYINRYGDIKAKEEANVTNDPMKNGLTSQIDFLKEQYDRMISSEFGGNTKREIQHINGERWELEKKLEKILSPEEYKNRIQTLLDENKLAQDTLKNEGYLISNNEMMDVRDPDAAINQLLRERIYLEKKLDELKGYDEKTDESLDSITSYIESQKRKAAEKIKTKEQETKLKQLNKLEISEQKPIKSIKDNVEIPDTNKLPLDLQFFADKARKMEQEINDMADGEEKNRLKKALTDFWSKLKGSKTKEEAEEAWNSLSKTRTNTMAKSRDYTEYELKNVFREEDARYLREAETIPYDAAKEAIQKNPKAMLKRYTQKFATDKDARAALGNAQDINGMHIMIQDISKRARNTIDIDKRSELYAQARQISRNLYKANRELGRGVQANAKFSRTPERAIQNVQGFAENQVEKALKNQPKLQNDIAEVSKKIEGFLADMDTAALKREEVEEMVNKAISMNNRVRQRIGKGDVKKITDAIMNEKQYCDVQKELEFLSTGFQDLDSDTIEKVQNIFEEAQKLNFNSKKRMDMENEAYKLLATKICPSGGTFRDKFDAWRYLSMLANPTTHLKNITGNVLFGQGMVSAKNNIAAMIEEAADRVSKIAGKGGIDRTKSILTPKDSALVKAAKEDGLENAFRDLSGSKYFDVANEIDRAIPAYNTKTPLGQFLNKASEINTGALEKEDEIAMLAKYQTSLAGYLKANGADVNIFKATDEKSKALLENAREYAINQAKEAAFHQDAPFMQKFSNFTQNLRDGSKGEQAAGLALDTIVPFKKTPANILKSAFAYSPLEWAKVITDLDALKNGATKSGKIFKAADFIDDISKATTGTAAFGIGALLAHEGILKVGSDKSDEEESFDKQTGRQNVAIKVGNKYVAVQELIPSAAPLIFGGTVYETLANKKGGENALDTIFAGAGAIANGVIDMSMLSGITDTLKSVRSAKDNSEVLTSLAINTGSNLASQLLPTLGRKTNVTLDDTKRATYSDKVGASKTIDQEAKYLQTKIPGLQQAGEAMKKSNNPTLQKVGNRLALQPNIDVKGQVQDSPGIAGINNIGGRAISNFLSPVNVTKDRSTKYDEERRRLEKATGETKVLPYIATDEAKINDRKLSPEEWTKYRQTRGQLREKLAEGIIDSKTYKNLSDTDKADLLVKADNFSKAYSQGQYGKDMSKENKELAEVYKKQGVDGFINYISYKNNLKAAGNSRQETKLNVVKKMSPEAQKEMLPKIMTKEEQKRWKAANGNLNQYWKMYDAAQKTAQEKAIKKRDQEYRQSVATQKAFDRLGISKEQGAKIQEELASYGAIDKPETVKYYAHAKQTIPSLTPKEYVGYLDKLSRGDNKISQADVIKYANEHNLSQSEMNTYWNAFTDTKKIPKLSRKGNWYYK